jgi:tyrosine-protein kinase Etk/Wzc
MNHDYFDFGGWLLGIRVHWRQHVGAGLLAAALMAGISFLMPNWYRATATLLPPEETDQSLTGLPIQRFLSRMPTLSGLSNYYTPSDIFRAILMSRSVQQPLLERNGMQKVYRRKNFEETLREFRAHARIALMPDGTITVSVEDRSRDRAAVLANGLVEELDRFNVERRNFQAKRARVFLEHRVEDTDSMARRSEAALSAYQEQHHVVVPVNVEDANLGPLADLMARKMALEVRLAVLRSYLQDSNDQVVQVRSELEKLKSQIGTLPGVETELGRLIRDVRLYQQVYALLSSQLEDARMREVMDTPTVTVLDEASPPVKKSRPLRSLWVMGAALGGCVASVLWRERAGLLSVVRPA